MGRGEKPPEEGAPLWMCTYGDLMSLLLCFFIMLFAISIIAEVKLEAFIETIEAKMGYLGQSPKQSNSNKPATSSSTTSERARRTADRTGGQPTPGPSGESVPQQTISMTGEVVQGGLIRFALRSDELTELAKDELKALFPKLNSSPRKILVQGYAAPVEMEEEKDGEPRRTYSRDVFLARARAEKVMDYLVSLGLKPEFFQMNVSDSTTVPNRAILPRGTDMQRAGASAAVYLLDQTTRKTEEKEETTAPE